MGLTAILVAGVSALGVPATATAAECARTELTIVAHQDDDLLFMNPDIQESLDAGGCLVNVFLTAGDGGNDAEYWQRRESGSEAAYATVLGLEPEAEWAVSHASYDGQNLRTVTSPDTGTVTDIFLRLPDGGLSGAGFSSTGDVSLQQLWEDQIPSLTAVDSTATYSRAALVSTLSAIVEAVRPAAVRVQDARAGQGDHSDHRWGALFALEALEAYDGEVQAYVGYGSSNSPANVSGEALAAKTAALVSYAAYDPLVCPGSTCPSGAEAAWNERQYQAPVPNRTLPSPGPAPYDGPNVARNASIRASSEAAGQDAGNAIDAVVAGYPANGGAEWSSDGQRAGAWLELTWAQAQTVDRVHLFDRPNGADHIQGGTLTFSDGSTVSVPALNNDGSATVVTFPARAITSLRFAVTATSTNTDNAGLAELEAYDGVPVTDPTPTPTPTPTPPPSATPTPTPGTGPRPGPAPYGGANKARDALVAASSQAAGQDATRAIDALIDGYPGSAGAEWSSDGERGGAWLELTWTQAQTVDRVHLFDRPNGADHVLGGTLTFSDGSTAPVPALNNDGTGTIVTFPPRSTTAIRFTAIAVSASTGNVGLAEIEAYDGDPSPAPDPEPEADPVPGPATYDGPNAARNALVLASSQSSGQDATRAIDAVIGGYPGSAGAEWSSDGERTGAWLRLTWSEARTVDRVHLFDRPNAADHIQGGTLTFSDGSTVSVPALSNDGSATVVTFAARATTAIRFTVTSTSASTENVGLAEIEAYDGDPSPTPDPTPDPDPADPLPGPAAYAGPNVARNALVMASSQAAGQDAVGAIDAVIAGYPGDAGAEWSSAAQGSGAWLELTWTQAQTVDRVRLFDRPNGSDQVQGGTLTFSDGSTVSVPALDNDGSMTVVTFPARSTTSIRFTVTAVSASTANVGLAELEAYSGDPSQTGTAPAFGPAAGSDGPDLALNALVSASSQAVGQEAIRAVDGVRAGYPQNGGAEWSSEGERSGAWLHLAWTQAQTVDRIHLYDRPNGADHIQGGTLTFSDGSTVSVPALNNDGSATVVSFPARSATSIRFTVTAVSGSTGNVGVAEIEAYDGEPNA